MVYEQNRRKAKGGLLLSAPAGDSTRVCLNQAHAEIVLPLVLADFINGHDVGMRKAGRRFGFGLKTFDQLLGGQRAGTAEFEAHQVV